MQCIILDYMQYNIYFRKDNWDRFKNEPSKSDLINSLLASHYGLNPGGEVGRDEPKLKGKVEVEELPHGVMVEEKNDEPWDGPLPRNGKKL